MKFGDNSEKIGSAHLLEHLLWPYSDRSIYSSAVTTPYSTQYVAFINRRLKRLFKRIFSRFTNPEFNERNISREKIRIKHEILNKVDDPYDYGVIRLASLKYGIKTLPQDYIKYIDELTAEDLRESFQKFYTLNNIVIYLVIPKDKEEEEILREIKDHFSNLPKGSSYSSIIKPSERDRRNIEIRKGTKLFYLFIGFEGPAVDDKNFLYFWVTSELVRSEVRYRILSKSVIYDIKTRFESLLELNTSFMEFSAAILKERYIKNVLSLINESIEVLKKGKIKRKRLNKAKNNVINSYLNWLAYDSIENIEATLDFLMSEIKYDEKFVENIREVTTDDIRFILERYFTPDNTFVYLLTPKKLPSSYFNLNL